MYDGFRQLVAYAEPGRVLATVARDGISPPTQDVSRLVVAVMMSVVSSLRSMSFVIATA